MPRDFRKKLGLGTVQFGQDYGISNLDGQTSPDEVEKILDLAKDHDIRLLDTARLYGDSEKVLGNIISNQNDFDIVTKILSINNDRITRKDIDFVKNGFFQSLDLLKQKRLYGLLVHSADDLLREESTILFRFLSDLKADGFVQKIGASVYHQKQIDAILEQFKIDLIQLPANVFDQKFISSGTLKKLKSFGIEIHVRSAFLQGIVFMHPNELPLKLKPIVPYLERFKSLADEFSCTPSQMALAFLMQQKEIDKVICGVNSCRQLQSLINDMRDLPDLDPVIFQSLSVSNPALVNPVHW